MSKFIFEQIQTPLERSFKYLVFDQNKPNIKNFNWHYHPEIELVYIDSGTGIKGVGNHLSNYYNGDLILVGSNLRHMGFTESFSDGKTEVVVQFKPEFLGNSLINTPIFTPFRKKVEKNSKIRNEVSELPTIKKAIQFR